MSHRQEFKLIDLDLEYDTLTIYINFNTVNGIKFRKRIIKGPNNTSKEETLLEAPWGASEEDILNTLYFHNVKERMKFSVFKLDNAQKDTKDNTQLLRFNKFTKNWDDDHALYHQNKALEQKKDHIHVKFKNKITKEQLKSVLPVLVEEKLLTQDNSDQYQEGYKNRESKFITTFEEKLAQLTNISDDSKKYIHKTVILNFIKNCDQNDLLESLHLHLLNAKFDYLRKATGLTSISFWQGTNANGAIVSTTKTWAQIERAITLKMSMNIANKCHNFSTAVARDHSTQLERNNAFFSIKRYSIFGIATGISSSFEAFRTGDRNTLNEKYKSQFSN